MCEAMRGSATRLIDPIAARNHPHAIQTANGSPMMPIPTRARGENGRRRRLIEELIRTRRVLVLDASCRLRLFLRTNTA